MSPKAKTAIVTLSLGVVALVWEAFALATGEAGAWTFSRLVWDLTGNPLTIFAGGMLAGHFYFPKSKCLHCGFKPYRADRVSQNAFDIALQRFADLFGRHTLEGAKKHAGFPLWCLLLVLLPTSLPAAPSLSMRAYPQVSFAPSTVRVSARLTGAGKGTDFICPSIAWTWGDGCRSTDESDCDPYKLQEEQPTEARFSGSHRYYLPGEYRVEARVTGWNNRSLIASRAVLVKGDE